MKILIIGGGIAGITLAHQIQKTHQVTLVERGSAWRTIGYGVGVFEHGLDVLKKLSLDDDFWASGHTISEVELLSSKKGVMDFTMRPMTAEVKPYVTMAFERESIHAAIHKKLEHVAVRFDTSIKSIANDDCGAQVEFSDGNKERFDLIVGADGLRSTVRSMVFGDKLKSYGWNVWGVWAPPVTQAKPGYYIISGPGETVFGFPCLGRSAVCFLYKTSDRPTVPESKDEMLKKFPLLKDQIADMVSSIDDLSSVLHDTLQYVEMDAWYEGRVVLIGDSRHGMSPISAMGTSLALEDGYVLADELNKNEDIDAALQGFARRRDARLKSIAPFRKLFETIGMVESPVIESLRNLGLRLMPRSAEKLLGYLLGRISNTKL